jgi:hypothetical protein
MKTHKLYTDNKNELENNRFTLNYGNEEKNAFTFRLSRDYKNNLALRLQRDGLWGECDSNVGTFCEEELRAMLQIIDDHKEK